MTIKKLNSLYWINKQLEVIKSELDGISEISSINYTGMPSSNKVGDPTQDIAILKAKYINELEKQQKKLLKTKMKIHNFVKKIEDEEVKVIATNRFILNKSWSVITKEIYNNYCDTYTPRRRLYRYLNKIGVN